MVVSGATLPCKLSEIDWPACQVPPSCVAGSACAWPPGHLQIASLASEAGQIRGQFFFRPKMTFAEKFMIFWILDRLADVLFPYTVKQYLT